MTTLYVHPDELWKVRMATWRLLLEGSGWVDVKASPLVSRGECLVTNPDALPPVSLDAQRQNKETT